MIMLGMSEVEFVPCCAHCGKAITPDTPANIEFENLRDKQSSHVVLLHKGCSRAYRQGKGHMSWTELVSIEIKTR